MTPEWLLFDGSSAIFRAFYGVPQSFKAPDGFLVNAVRGTLDRLANVITERKPRHVALTTDEDWRPDWRVELIPGYKVHRVAEPVPPALIPQMPVIMEALAETHDGSVQMIDTSIVRVHQHGGCAGGGETRLMGRSRGGLTTKMHACVDTNGMPVRFELTAGEAHDNRLVTELLPDLKPGAILLADRGYDADWIRAFVSQQGA